MSTEEKNSIKKEIRMTSKNDVLNELYTAAVLTVGAVGVSYVSKKVTKDSLGLPTTPNGVMKLAVAIGLSAVGVKYLQDKDYIPKEVVKDDK